MDLHPFPDDEPGRLAAVRRLDLIGTPPEAGFDRLVRLAATVLDVPIAWISLLDSDRSWFKARVGLEIGETSREGSLCAAAIAHPDDDVFVVEDAWLDDRFENHPLVLGPPRVRFYAGRVLRSPEGYALGTLSVVGREPRTLGARDRLALADLASLVEDQMRAGTPDDLDEPDELGAPIDAPIDESAPTVDALPEPVSDTLPDLDPDSAVERRLESAELMLAHTSDAIVVLDESAQLKFASPSFERILGYPVDHRPIDGALGIVHPEDRMIARAGITNAMADSEPTTFTARVLTASGSIRNMECTAHSYFARRAVGGVVVVMRDVSERHLLSQMLAFQSTHDRLTELPNRVLFQEHLTPALARAARDHRVVAVCLLNLVGFQELNDQLGYAAGDELLVGVAKRLRASIRTGDSAARLGNDQFGVLLDPVADAHEAVRVAERLVTAASGPHSLQDGVSDCGANVGVAVSSDSDDQTTIVARASRALTEARQSGSGNVVLAPADEQRVEAGPEGLF